MSLNSAANGLSPRVAAVIAQMGIMLPGQGESASLIPANKYSKLAITAAGLSPDGNTKFSFFQSAYAPQTCNVRQPGKFTQSGVFLATGIGFDIWGVGDVEIDDDATAFDFAAPFLKYLRQGYIRFEKNSKLILEDFGLGKYPNGGGAVVTSAVENTNTTVVHQAATVNNGVADVRNRHQFPMPIVFTPNDTADFSVDFGTAIALLAGTTGIILATVYGYEVVDSDR
jgi:hypothetical protein